MKFSCFQNELINAINTVQKAISSKTNIDNLKGILLEVDNSSIKLTGSNLNLSIEVVIDAVIETKGSIVLESRLFGEIIRKLPDATIDFILKDNHIEINCLHSAFKLMANNAEEYPKLPIIKNSKIINFNQNQFKKMIKQTIFAVSNDESRPILTGSLLEIKNNKMTMVSIDGYRLAMKTLDVDLNIDSKTVIPGKTLSELMKILGLYGDDDFKIDITNKYISFTINKIRIISKILEGEFIKYNQIIPTDFNTKVIVNTNEFCESIERASLMARDTKSVVVKMSFKDHYVDISSISELGSVNDKVNIKFEGEKFDLGFNPRYLIEVLKVIESEEVLIELSSSLSPCTIKPINKENYLYLLLPVRMSN